MAAGGKAADIKCNSACFAKLGIKPSSHVRVKDVWANTNNGNYLAAK